MKKLLPFSAVCFGAALIASESHAQTNTISLRLDDESRTFFRDVTGDRWLKKETLVSTVVGGALAIAGGFAASWYAHQLQKRHRQEEKAEFKNNVTSAIRRELEVLGDLYGKAIGLPVEKLAAGEVLDVRFCLTEEWFTVFTANAGHLGKMDGDVSRKVVTAYALLKGLIEEFRINNEYLARAGDLEVLHRSRPDLTSQLQSEQLRRLLIEQAKRIKSAHTALKAQVDDLFRLLDERGIR